MCVGACVDILIVDLEFNLTGSPRPPKGSASSIHHSQIGKLYRDFVQRDLVWVFIGDLILRSFRGIGGEPNIS